MWGSRNQTFLREPAQHGAYLYIWPEKTNEPIIPILLNQSTLEAAI